jgi:hypothetical protein
VLPIEKKVSCQDVGVFFFGVVVKAVDHFADKIKFRSALLVAHLLVEVLEDGDPALEEFLASDSEEAFEFCLSDLAPELSAFVMDHANSNNTEVWWVGGGVWVGLNKFIDSSSDSSSDRND